MKSLWNRLFSKRKPKLLFKEDPEAFFAIVKNHNAKDRVYGLHTFDDMMVCEMLRCGLFDDPAVRQETNEIYNGLFLKAEPDRRTEIYEHVRAIVSIMGGKMAGALLPFMLLDPDMVIAATATVDYTSTGSLTGDEPMSRPKDVLNVIDARVPANTGAVIGGLLALGDPRVCNLVAPLRSTIDPQESRVITRCYPGRTAKCVVDFYLDWADELVEEDDDDSQGIFGDVVAGLWRLGQLRRVPAIFDGLRPFPSPDDGQWPNLHLIPFDEFAQSISERLFDLEQREAAPRIIPRAIRAFGLEPRTPPEDIVAMPTDVPYHFSPRYH
jgi:hypothetical protein